MLHETPIGLLNGARGGMPIGFFQRNDANRTDLATNYGRLLTRMQIGRGVGACDSLGPQGESDGADFQTHHDGFLALKADWAEDYAGVERLNVTRASCGLRRRSHSHARGAAQARRRLSGDHRDVDDRARCARRLPLRLRRWLPRARRPLYGAPRSRFIRRDAADPRPASEPRQRPVRVGRYAGRRDHAEARTPHGRRRSRRRLSIRGRRGDGGERRHPKQPAVLTIAGDASGATGLTYLGHVQAGPWVLNENGIGLLTFYELPIAPE